MHMRMKYFLSLFLLLTLAAVGGCKHPSDPPGKLDSTIVNGDTATVPWVTPHPGSMFLYSPAFYGPLDTVVILANGLTFNNKPNVTSFDTLHSVFGISGYLAIEPNGDISIGDTNEVVESRKFVTDFAWWTFPTGSHKPITALYFDSTYPWGRFAESRINYYVGTDTVMIPNQVLGTIHVRSIMRTYDSSSSRVDSGSQAIDYWFAPSIGTVVRTRSYAYWQGQPVYPRESNLAKYVLK